MMSPKLAPLLLLVIGLSGAPVFGQPPAFSPGFDISPLLDAYNVRWDTPGPTSFQSMPVGNGDIGLNVWVEPGGDLAFYIGKTDAWGENVEGSQGLMKVGGIHISINPSPLSRNGSFTQILKLHEGEIQIKEGNGLVLRIWVDANHPVIRIEAKSDQPVSFKVKLDNWRKDNIGSQRIPSDKPNQIVWYHRNPDGPKAEPHVANLTFGAGVNGEGLVVGKDPATLESATPTTTQLISIYPLTAITPAADDWLDQLGRQISQLEKLDLEQTRRDHQKWWDQFWHRSWIFARGNSAATEVTQGYILQRFVTACAGRGSYPVKFNGSIFVVDNPARIDESTKSPAPVDADYRDWGGQYWFQNTRAMYWPRLQAGDFDELMPLFKMYETIVKSNEAQVKTYYGHEGSYFVETAPFWGGLKYVGSEMPPSYTDHYFTGILELGMMMLDYYEYTGDKKFAKETAIPVIALGLIFFNRHFHPGPDGKLLLDPDNATETYWKTGNPAPDIAGLHAILARMIALPENLVDQKDRDGWKKMQSILPELPKGIKNGKSVLLPYAGSQIMKSHNGENPELYAIYPFRLYGLEKPDLDLAIRTFNARKWAQKGCWVQDPVQAAMLGLSDMAKDYVHFNLTRTDPKLKFTAFWARGCDYEPDEDNGGNGENGFQQMLLQAVDKKILLFPAWPKDWDVEFKLNAPYETTVQGKFEKGKLVDLIVTPPARRSDIIDMSLRVARAVEPKTVGKAGSVTSIISPHDSIVALKQTTKSKPNVLAESNEAENVAAVIDRDVDSKYFNRGRDTDEFNPSGVNTGFVITPTGRGIVRSVQFATADDMPTRDPLRITIEGSNNLGALAAQENGFTLLYEGPTGLAKDPGRKQWGPVIEFSNNTPYKSYRVLVTETRAENADAVQYSEVKLGK